MVPRVEGALFWQRGHDSPQVSHLQVCSELLKLCVTPPQQTQRPHFRRRMPLLVHHSAQYHILTTLLRLRTDNIHKANFLKTLTWFLKHNAQTEENCVPSDRKKLSHGLRLLVDGGFVEENTERHRVISKCCGLHYHF